MENPWIPQSGEFAWWTDDEEQDHAIQVCHKAEVASVAWDWLVRRLDNNRAVSVHTYDLRPMNPLEVLAVQAV